MRVRLAGPPELTTECALPALASLVAKGLQLEVTLGRPAEDLLQRLTAGEFDIVLSTIRPLGADLAVTRLPDEEFVLVAAPEWVEGIDAKDPTGAPLVAVSASLPVIRRYWLTMYDKEPPGPPAVTVRDLRGAMNLVRRGAGITVLPRYLCKEQLASGELVDLVRPKAAPTNHLFLAVHAKSAGMQDAKAVHDRLAQSARSW